MLRHTSCPSKRYRLAGHPVQSYRPAPGHSTASSLPATTMVEPAMSLSSSAAPAAMEKRAGNTTRESRQGIGFGTVYYVDGILNRVRNRYSRSDRSVLKQFPAPPRSVSHDRGSPRSSIPLSLVVATAKRCLSVHNGHTGNFTLFVFKKRAHSGPFFSETSYQD